MLFNSLAFLIFGALFFSLWPVMKRRETPRLAFLVASSFVFYGWWDWRFLFLILFSGSLDFYAARGMAAWPRWRRAFLGISLLGNLGSLCAFKYSVFLARSLDAALGTQLAQHVPPFLAILPVGISFYTFQSMSYTIDVYRGELEPTDSFLHFFAYLALFPQLVAGPIVRARSLLPQLRGGAPTTTEEGRWEGTRLIAHGYFKKVVLADNLGPVVDRAFGAVVPSGDTVFWWAVITCFAFQIYCDFSGYTDIARGLARYMGYDFGPNFNHPYTATSLRDFWRRWHMSLSTWFRDYLYIPLGGSRRGPVRGMLNMAVTMVVAGLWHGAAWTFVIWGALHAVWLGLERVTRLPQRLGTSAAGRIASCALVLLLVWVSWVFFRATSLTQALEILTTMFAFQGSLRPRIGPDILVFLALIAGREAQVFFGLDPGAWLGERRARRAEVVFIALVLALCVVLRGPGAAFIYFQF